MASARLVLDKRKVKADSTYPVKIRIAHVKDFQRLGTTVSLTEAEFEKLIIGKYLSKEMTAIKADLDALIIKANGIIDDLQPFNFDDFNTRFIEKGNKTDLLFLLANQSEAFRNDDKVSSANLYNQALVLLTRYNATLTKSGELPITSVNPKWLQGFEKWALKLKRTTKKGVEISEYNKTTLGMYLIRVRAIFNYAISEKILPANAYPFHRPDNQKGYSIPKGTNNKRPLSKIEIMQIYNFKTDNAGEQFAKDIFLFSYLSNGMNAIDIFRLKWSDVASNFFRFVRKKTENKPGGANEITVRLNEDLLSIIARHGTRKLNNPYIFNVIPGDATEKVILQKVRSKIGTINPTLKRIAVKLGITSDISTYFARHSFATNLMNSEAPLALISQALGHSKISTTENYLSAFSSDKAQQYMDNLLDKSKTA